MAVLFPAPWSCTITSCSELMYQLTQKRMDDVPRLSTCITSKAAAYAEMRRLAAQKRGHLERGCLPPEVRMPAAPQTLTLQQQELQLIGKGCLIRHSWLLSQGPSGEGFSQQYSSSQGIFSITHVYKNSSVTQSST